MKLHLWEAYNPKKISVDIKKEFKNTMQFLMKGKINSIAYKFRVSPTRFYEYFHYQTYPIPLNILIKLCKVFEIPLEEMERNIILYKHKLVPFKNSVKNPKLPLEITPYFTSIVSNLYFDGSLPKDGKGAYYNQKNSEIMSDFIKRLQLVFGDVQYTLVRDHKGVLKCSFPRVVGEICKSVYQVDSFNGNESYISKEVFNLNKEHKIAFILPAITDEGCITYDGEIIFGVSNKKLCEDIRKLCIQINLNVNALKNKKNDPTHYYFYIKSLKGFNNLVTKLSKKFPFISLGYKEKRLKIALKIKKQKSSHTKESVNKRSALILNELKNKECSINYLALKHLIRPRTLRNCMYKLIKEKRVNRKKIKNEYFYFLID